MVTAPFLLLVLWILQEQNQPEDTGSVLPWFVMTSLINLVHKPSWVPSIPKLHNRIRTSRLVHLIVERVMIEQAEKKL